MGCLYSHLRIAPKSKKTADYSEANGNNNGGLELAQGENSHYPPPLSGMVFKCDQGYITQNQILNSNLLEQFDRNIYVPGRGYYQLIDKCDNGNSGGERLSGEKNVFADDFRLPLSRRQIFALSKSWKGISRNMDTTGVIMFVKGKCKEPEIDFVVSLFLAPRLFSSTPKLLPLFRNIVVEGENEKLVAVKDSIELETHAEIVMNTIDEAISNFGDFDKFNQILTSIGCYHYALQDFRVEYFWLAEEPFLEAVKETLGDRYTMNMENIYKVTIKFILTTLVKGYSMAKEPKH